MKIIDCLNEKTEQGYCNAIVITGNSYFDCANWKGLKSNDKYENDVLESLWELKFREMPVQKAARSFQCNKSKLNYQDKANDEVNKSYSSDH